MISAWRLALGAMLLTWGGAQGALAAQLAGVSLPPSQTVGNTVLVLNGIGLRTYSVFSVNVYVAGLYLQEPSHDANAILSSNGEKMLLLHFVHDVGADKIRGAWREGLLRNCPAPCDVTQTQISTFLNSLQAMHAGENVELLFSQDGVHAYYDQQPAGYIANPEFARLMLAVFIGPQTAVPKLRQELLGLQQGVTVAAN